MRLLVCVLLAMGSVLAFSQSQATTGVISGRITAQADNSGMPGVEVSLLNTATNYKKVVTTDAEGRFRGLLLPLGPYKVMASKTGYFIAVQEGVQVTVGASVTINLALKKIEDQDVLDRVQRLEEMDVAAQTEILETVTVVAEDYDAVVEVARTEASTQIDEEEIQGLPNNGRNFLDFMTLTPGVTIVQGPDGAELSANGQKGINNNISVDGADFNNPFFGEQRGGQRPAFTFNLDAVQEVVVVSDGAPAEFGRSSGAFVNVITKSGTNQTEGTVHTFLKQEELSARPQSPDGSKVPEFEFDNTQIGFTLGGPLIKDRLFYFTSFDFQAGGSTKQTDPTRIDPDVVAYFDSIGIVGENGPIERTDDAHAFLFKVDYNINELNLLTMRVTNTYSEQENGTFDVDSWGVSANAIEEAKSRSFSAQLNTVINMNMINELRVQVAREDRPRPYNGPNIAGTNRPLPDTAFDFARSFRHGMPFFIPVTYHDTRIQLNDNLSIIRGSHLIKVGAEVNYTRAAQTFQGFANGRWIFSSTEGFLNYTQNAQYTECADSAGNFTTTFTGGCPEGYQIVGPVLLYLQQAGVGGLTAAEAGTQTIETLETALFFQDKWDISPTMSLQYGVRWEAQFQPDPITPPDEVFYAPFIGTTSMGQEFPSDGTIPDDDTMIQPRLGFTWDPSGLGTSVLRASAGIYHARTPGLILASTRSTNGSRGQTLFRNSAAAPFLGAPPAYPNLIPQDEIGDPVFPDVFVFDKDFQNPYSINFSATYEQEIAPATAAYVKFSYVKGLHQVRFVNRNDPLLGSPWGSGLGDDGGNGINTLTTAESTGESLYRGATIGINRQMTQNFAMQANYTYSKDKSHDDNERDPFSFRYARVTDLDAEWGYSDRDQRHRGNLWLLYHGPWGINANMRYSYRSAQPISLTENGTIAQTPDQRINADGTIMERNTGRKNNKFSSIDLRLSKVFSLNRWDLEAVIEVFNLTNEENFLNPSVTNLIFNFDGTVQSGAGEPRQVQIGLKGRF